MVLRHLAVANQRRWTSGGAASDASRAARPERAVGDTLEHCRVEAYKPGRRLRLGAGMNVPGGAWLEIEVEPVANGAVVHQTAVFELVGLFGPLDWHAPLPVHALIFEGVLRAIVRRARSRS